VLLGALERVKLANVKRLDYLDAVLRQWGAPRPDQARASPGGGGRARRAPRSCSPYAQGLTAEEERRNRMVLEPFSEAPGERPDPTQNLTEPSSFPNNHGV